MKNKILLFILISSPLLSQTCIYAQGIYTTTGIYFETGFNTMGKINYTNSGPINSISERSQSAEPMFEVGGGVKPLKGCSYVWVFQIIITISQTTFT